MMETRSRIKTFVFIVFVVFIASASSYITFYKVERGADISHVNVLLYDLDEEIDLLDYCVNNIQENNYLVEKIKKLILSKILILRAVNPQMEDLRGVPLEALYRLVRYSKDFDFRLKENDDFSQLALNYLGAIENALIQRIKQREKIKSNPMKPGFNPLKNEE